MTPINSYAATSLKRCNRVLKKLKCILVSCHIINQKTIAPTPLPTAAME